MTDKKEINSPKLTANFLFWIAGMGVLLVAFYITPGGSFEINAPASLPLKPIAAVGYPACGKNTNGGGARPPERKHEIGQRPKTP